MLPTPSFALLLSALLGNYGLGNYYARQMRAGATLPSKSNRVRKDAQIFEQTRAYGETQECGAEGVTHCEKEIQSPRGLHDVTHVDFCLFSVSNKPP